MTIEEVMTRDVITVDPATPIHKTAQLMVEHGVSGLPVVNDDGRLVGIVSERDLGEHRGHLEHTKVNGVMTELPVTVTPATTLEEAAQILLERQIGALPVLVDGRLVGIITTSDIVKAFLDVMGASEGGSARLDFVLEGEERGFVERRRSPEDRRRNVVVLTALGESTFETAERIRQEIEREFLAPLPDGERFRADLRELLGE